MNCVKANMKVSKNVEKVIIDETSNEFIKFVGR